MIGLVLSLGFKVNGLGSGTHLLASRCTPRGMRRGGATCGCVRSWWIRTDWRNRDFEFYVSVWGNLAMICYTSENYQPYACSKYQLSITTKKNTGMHQNRTYLELDTSKIRGGFPSSILVLFWKHLKTNDVKTEHLENWKRFFQKNGLHKNGKKESRAKHYCEESW